MLDLQPSSLSSLRAVGFEMQHDLDSIRESSILKQSEDIHLMEKLSNIGEKYSNDLTQAGNHHLREAQEILQAICSEEHTMGETLSLISERLDESMSLMRPGRMPSQEQIDRIRNNLTELRNWMHTVCDRNQAITMAHETLHDRINGIEVNETKAPDEPGLLSQHTDGSVQISGRLPPDLLEKEPDFKMPTQIDSINQDSPDKKFSIPCVNLRDVSQRVQEGIKPSNQVPGAKCSDDTQANKVVCFNTVRVPLQTTRDASALNSFVSALMNNRGAGPLSIALENRNDGGKFSENPKSKEILQARLYQTAIFVIDPKKLNHGIPPCIFEAARTDIYRSEGSISGEIDRNSIVATIVSNHSAGVSDGLNLIKVGDQQSNIHYNKDNIEINLQHPDYGSGIQSILKNNPGKTLLLHLSRF